MEPRIQYARTADGVSIAYWTMGDGPAFIHTPPPISQIELEWQFEENRRWYESLARGRTLVRYDPRGQGLSDRDVDAISLETQILDLQAVVDRIGLESFDLFGVLWQGPASIAYAATKPEAVDHLLLWCTSPNGQDLSTPATQVTRALMDVDWNTYTQMVSHLAFGWSAGDAASRFAVLIREAITPEILRKTGAAVHATDATDQLPKVQVPTLVLHRREAAYPPMPAVRRLAADIPKAHLVLLDGDAQAPYVGGMDAVVRAIDEFVGGERTAQSSAAAHAGLRTVLFTDLVGHTELMSRLGDEAGREVLREHERITRETLAAHGGAEIKTMGDGFMASFGSVTRAVECAIALQRAIDERNQTVGAQSPAPLHIRIGLNAGEPIEEDGDLFGATVILASRIAARAEGGEILVSDTVRGLCSGKGFLFSDRGEFVAKGFEEPVRVYEVRWRETMG